MQQASDFLADNPVATADQRELEDRALRLLQRPEVQRARAIVTQLWRSVMAWPAREQMSRFEAMIDEYVFYYALRAVNSDALYPRVVRLMTPPGHWFGRSIPGSRWGGDSPDFVYRMMPVAAGSSYTVQGRAGSGAPFSVSFSLMAAGAAPATIASLDSEDLQFNADGSFTLTIDPHPAQGRTNHLQTRADVDHVLVRDVLAEWNTDVPYSLQVHTSTSPARAPLAEEQWAQRAARELVDSFYFTYFCTQSGAGQPPNQPREPSSSGAFGGMATQWGTKSNLILEADEALLITANQAGAAFRNICLSDLFFMSNEYGERTSSFNMTQMVADSSGDFSFVVAHEDPGIHNWLDTGGLRQTILGHRWQQIPASYSGEPPRLQARVIKVKALDAALDSGVCSISSEQRRVQLQARSQGYQRRWLDRASIN